MRREVARFFASMVCLVIVAREFDVLPTWKTELRSNEVNELIFEKDEIKKEFLESTNKVKDLEQQLESKKHLDGSALFGANEICSFFPTPTFTASKMWADYLPIILNISHYGDIPDLITPENDNKMHELLYDVLTPYRLRKSVQHLPTGIFSYSHGSVKHVMDVVQKRILDPYNNPPLRVAVFGGSVTAGIGCSHSNYNMCSWVRRFELLVNGIANINGRNKDKNIIQVYNLAIQGTSTSVATRLIKYWMYPDELKGIGPDVIIHSFSTNDSHEPDGLQDEKDRIPLISKYVREQLQDFIRTALRNNPCSIYPPLIVDVDDYLGPLNPGILAELSYATISSQVAKWYDITAISYGEVVRDIVYNNTESRIFFNDNPHYGFMAHQTVAWSVGFGALELVSNYCNDEYWQRKERQRKANVEETNVNEPHKFFLPPLLTQELLVKNVTKEFNIAHNAANEMEKEAVVGCGEMKSSNSSNIVDSNPCFVSWITMKKSRGVSAGFIQNFFRKHSVNNWTVDDSMNEGWGNKVGWHAIGSPANFTLSYSDLPKMIKSITIFHLKSYGRKWDGSRIRVTIEENNADNGASIKAISEISGFHNVNVSITMPTIITLPEVIRKGSSMNIYVDLIGGTTFKIMGMTMCKF